MRTSNSLKRNRIPETAACLVVLAVLALAVRPAAAGALDGVQVRDADYKIGAKDLLEIKVFELPELSQTVRVAEDGSISLTLLGKVQASGLNAQDLEKKLAGLLDQKYTQAAHVTVFIREYQKASVFGAVTKPGNFELVGPTTLLQLISQAGGLTADASDEIFVFRQEQDGAQKKIAVNLDELINKGNQELNINIQPNDVVNVPLDQTLTVYLYGEVRNPGAIQFKRSKKVTVVQAISQAGGLSEWASGSRVTVKRKDPATGKETQFRVNVKRIISGKDQDLILADGDVIVIP